jgi:uncharacterized protein (TIGR00375 family)
MGFIADLHIHSRFSRATSRELTFPALAAAGRRKGVALIGTGDCTHPAWLDEMAEVLTPDGDGLYRLRDGDGATRFLITGEISTIYKADGATRKVHHVVCLPHLDAARRFAARLGRLGNVTSDGRPILGLDSRDLLETLLEADPEAALIPAHIWTPWFSVLGSKSGFDRIEDCYRDLAGHIFAVETGLSSDPAMNWTVSALDRYTLVSNSDAHSPGKIGREANLFACEPGYTAVMDALRRRTPEFLGTLEFFPEEGKYHVDGHRKCGFACPPAESTRLGGRCPVCGGALTLGVEYRVAALADRPAGVRPAGAAPFQRLIPLDEVLAEVLETSSTSKPVVRLYEKLLAEVGPELFILREADPDALRAAGGELFALAIAKMRAGQVHAEAGYDGEYGVIRIFDDAERAAVVGQIQLFAGLPAAAKAAPASTPVAAEPDPAYAAPTGLSPEQQAAVDYPPAPLLITAGPGAGKTRTLTERIARLVEDGAAPETILAVTFSNRAARELAERLATRLPGPQPLVATFHRLGLRLCREFFGDVRVLAEEDAVAVPRPDDLETALAAQYADITDPRQAADAAARLHALAPEYADWKRARGVVDFLDLLVLPLAHLAAHPEALAGRWAHVLVDEYQDVNVFQYLLLRLLCPPGSSICAIGDPDQAIYGFRGAEVRYFLRFREDYPDAGALALTRNYRSAQSIVAAAAQVIAPTSLQAHALWSDRPGPARIDVPALPTPGAEAEYVVQTVEALLGGISHFSVDSGRGGDGDTALGFGDIAVLYRSHSVGEALVPALERSGIPYQRATRADLLGAPAVQAVLADLAAQPDELPAARSLLEAAARAGVTEDALGELPWTALLARATGTLADFRAGLALERDLDVYDPRAARVTLMTVHAAKGLEWEVVFLLGCEAGSFPHPASPEDEERRLFYVGLTRARTHLYCTHAATRSRGSERVTRDITPFLRDVDPSLLNHLTPAPPKRPAGRQLSLGELFG